MRDIPYSISLKRVDQFTLPIGIDLIDIYRHIGNACRIIETAIEICRIFTNIDRPVQRNRTAGNDESILAFNLRHINAIFTLDRPATFIINLRVIGIKLCLPLLSRIRVARIGVVLYLRPILNLIVRTKLLIADICKQIRFDNVRRNHKSRILGEINRLNLICNDLAVNILHDLHHLIRKDLVVHIHHELRRHIRNTLPLTAPRLNINLKTRLFNTHIPFQPLNRRHILKRDTKVVEINPLPSTTL